MKLSLIAAVSESGVIGSGLDIPWSAKGEQLLFKALTFNQWLIIGRKTFDSMGKLPNRKYAVISRSELQRSDEDVHFFKNTVDAIAFLSAQTDHAFVAGGGQIYAALLPMVDTIHLSRIHAQISGDVFFPELPPGFNQVFEQSFSSNIDYTYQIWRKA